MIYFDVHAAQQYCKYSTNNSVYRGLTELIRVGFVAKSSKRSHIYVDPRTVFNGNRIIVMEEYVKGTASNIRSEFEGPKELG